MYQGNASPKVWLNVEARVIRCTDLKIERVTCPIPYVSHHRFAVGRIN